MEYDPIPDDSPPPDDAPSREETPSEPSDPDTGRHRGRYLRWLILPIATGVLAALTGVVVGAMINKPEVEGLESFEHNLVTEIQDRHRATYRTYQRENRILIEANEMPELLKNAIMAAEDSNFLYHGGVDLKGILRAVYRNFRAGRRSEGASTLTMQVARQVFLHRRREWKRKVEEAFLAVELEKSYSKDQIITLWANLQNLGHGNYGMEAAAQDYFNKSVDELSLAEAATLAGIPNRPSDFLVRTRPEAVKKRRNYVLWRMFENEFITQAEYEAAAAEPVLAVPRRRERKLGPYFAEEVRRYLADAYGTTALYDRGLKVSTTLDPGIQRAAESALRQGLLRLDHGKGWRGAKEHFEDDDLENRTLPSWIGQAPIPGVWYEGIVLESDRRKARVKIEGEVYELGPKGMEWTRQKRPDRLLKRGDVSFFRFEMPAEEDRGSAGKEAEAFLVVEQEPEIEGAVLVLESATGAIRAMVGGWDYDRNEFNRATQAQRQIGSAFKAFVFGAALESGWSPADTLFDGPAVFHGADELLPYSPRNYYRKYYGVSTLRRALQSSHNVFAVKLMDLVGVDRVIDLAKRAGVRSELPPYPSLALGSADLIPLELAAAYATFVNNGIYVEPYFIEKVRTKDGRILEQHMPQAHQAMDPRHAYVLTKMLQGVAQRGTGASGEFGLAQVDVDVGGKTGTTNAYTDAWFVGFTPKYTLLTWVGYDKKRALGRGMTGAAAALPIWTMLLRRGLEEGWVEAGSTFERPPGIVEREIEYTTGLLASPIAKTTISEIFVEGNEPEKSFDEEWARIIELPWFLQEPFYLPKEGERMPSDIDDWSTVLEVWENKGKKEDEEKAEG